MTKINTAQDKQKPTSATRVKFHRIVAKKITFTLLIENYHTILGFRKYVVLFVFVLPIPSET